LERCFSFQDFIRGGAWLSISESVPKESGSTKLNFGDVTLLNPNALVGASQVCDIFRLTHHAYDD
jgi:hypothetical protein